MTTGTNADDAMVYTIASNQVNKIRYLKAVRTLLIGTTGGEFSVTADGRSEERRVGKESRSRWSRYR